MAFSPALPRKPTHYRHNFDLGRWIYYGPSERRGYAYFYEDDSSSIVRPEFSLHEYLWETRGAEISGGYYLWENRKTEMSNGY